MSVYHPQATIPELSARFLEELLLAASPTGNEQKIQRLILNRMRDVSDYVQTDSLGNVILGINADKKPKVLLAGHCDQIGYIVKFINSAGFLYLDSLGGSDHAAMLAQHVTIHT